MIATCNGTFPHPARRSGLDGATLDRITRETLEAQRRAGCDLITDGLGRYEDAVVRWAGRLEGVEAGDPATLSEAGLQARIPTVTREIAWTKPLLVEDFLFARNGSAVPVKPLLIGPYTLSRVAVDRAYDDPMALAMGFAIALNQELKALQAAGATWVQIDEPALPGRPEDFPLFTRLWEVLGRGVTLTLTLHLDAGDVRALIPGLARLKRLGCLSLGGRDNLEAIDAGAVPETVRLGIGVVDASIRTVESPDAIVAAVRALRGAPAADRLVLGSAGDLAALPPDIAFAKLHAAARARDQLVS